MRSIIIKGAKEHNLKNIDLELPRDQFIVISGLSGSGKSSLAFDTIFAEGQRRYVESLSAYARQFLGRMEKPNLDYIEGLSPTISIEQKSTNRNPRSTVGTITEIYDYYRLLFARIGVPHDPKTGAPITRQTVDEIIEALFAYPEGTALLILAPVIRGRKGLHAKVLQDARNAGYVRVRIDGTVRNLDEPANLLKNQKHTIEIIIDRLKIGSKIRSRLSEAVEAACEITGGLLTVVVRDENGERERSFSQFYAYPDSDLVFPELEPRLFSFNSPYGSCPDCSGLGITLAFEPELLMPDLALSFNQGGIAPYNPRAAWNRSRFRALARALDFNLDTPLNKLPQPVMQALLHGSDRRIKFIYENQQRTGKFEYETTFPGVYADLQRRYKETTSEAIKQWLESFMLQKPCITCSGRRLRSEALAVLVGGRNISEITAMSVAAALEFFQTLPLNDRDRAISHEVFKEINARLGFMQNVGLEYLTLDRNAATLSGGEAQRIRLATQIGSSLVGVLYILDEPSIGLHQRDTERLLRTLKHLRDIGNTLIVVEHDPQTIEAADYIVELGPGAGVHGGQVVAQGNLAELKRNTNSLTGRYLVGARRIEQPKQRRTGNGDRLLVRGVREHNLRNIDVTIPLGTLTVITGVSGSGKSTLMSDVLYPILASRLHRSQLRPGAFDTIEGVEKIGQGHQHRPEPDRPDPTLESGNLCRSFSPRSASCSA